MGRRITLYEAALAEAEATGGVTARQAAIAAFEKADFVFRVFHRIREYIAPAFGFLALLVLVALTVDWGLSGFTRTAIPGSVNSADLVSEFVIDTNGLNSNVYGDYSISGGSSPTGTRPRSRRSLRARLMRP
mgnify:CR=1 FL=1